MIVHCATCDGEGIVCPTCLKPWGCLGDARESGGWSRRRAELKNLHRRRKRCGVKRGDQIPCPNHTPSFARCDLRGEEAPTTARNYGLPDGWHTVHVPGPGFKTIHACRACLELQSVMTDAIMSGDVLRADELRDEKLRAEALTKASNDQIVAELSRRGLQMRVVAAGLRGAAMAQPLNAEQFNAVADMLDDAARRST